MTAFYVLIYSVKENKYESKVILYVNKFGKLEANLKYN